jgi:hypothetical protein
VISMRWWLALAGTVLAFGGAALASALSPSDYRATAVLVVGRGDAPLEPGRVGAALTESVAKLLDSNLIAADVIANLRLRESTQSLLRRVEASAVTPGLVRVGATDTTALRAEQIVQEITLIFPRIVRARFTGKNALRATVWDPARVVQHPDPGWGTSMGAAAGASAFLWLLAIVAPFRRPALRLPKPRPKLRRAPEAPTRPAPEPASNSPLLEPVGGSEEVAEDIAVAPPNGTFGFNLAQLESLVDAARERYPDRFDEWQAYVFYLRDHAEIDGSLPPNFHPLVEDVFAELLTGRS